MFSRDRGAIVGGIFSLFIIICIISIVICCCKSTCPLYQRRYRGQVIGPGNGHLQCLEKNLKLTRFSNQINWFSLLMRILILRSHFGFRPCIYLTGHSTVVTGGTTVAVTNVSGYAHSQQPTHQVQYGYGYVPRQDYVYSAAVPMPPPYPGRTILLICSSWNRLFLSLVKFQRPSYYLYFPFQNIRL